LGVAGAHVGELWVHVIDGVPLEELLVGTIRGHLSEEAGLGELGRPDAAVRIVPGLGEAGVAGEHSSGAIANRVELVQVLGQGDVGEDTAGDDGVEQLVAVVVDVRRRTALAQSTAWRAAELGEHEARLAVDLVDLSIEGIEQRLLHLLVAAPDELLRAKVSDVTCVRGSDRSSHPCCCRSWGRRRSWSHQGCSA